jgi:hypothetical protein
MTKRTELRAHNIKKQDAVVAALLAEFDTLLTDEQVNEWYARYEPAHRKAVALHE